MAIQMLIVDDHELVRAGLAKLISSLDNLEVVAEARNGKEALNLVAELHPDLVLMDIHMPTLNGLESTAYLKKHHPKVRTIILSMYSHEEYILRALKVGAKGYLLKDSGLAELNAAIRAVMLGEIYLDSSLEQTVSNYLEKLEHIQNPLQTLTLRQREVLQLVAQGYSSKAIGQELNISIKTVEAHRSKLMAALEIYDVAGLVRFAIRTGLISANS